MADVTDSSSDDGGSIGDTLSSLASSAATAFTGYQASQTQTQLAGINQSTYIMLGLIALAIVVIPRMIK